MSNDHPLSTPDRAQSSTAGPLSVLQVLPALETGGAERGAVDVACALAAAGGRAFVASTGGRMVRELERNGVKHFVLPVKTKNPFLMRANARRIARLAGYLKVDIIHARSRAPAWSAYWAAERTGIPFVTTVHSPHSAGGLKKRYNSSLVKGERIIAISDFIADYIHTTYGPVPPQVREHVVQHRDAAHGEKRLRGGEREGPEAGAEAGGRTGHRTGGARPEARRQDAGAVDAAFSGRARLAGPRDAVIGAGEELLIRAGRLPGAALRRDTGPLQARAIDRAGGDGLEGVSGLVASLHPVGGAPLRAGLAEDLDPAPPSTDKAVGAALHQPAGLVIEAGSQAAIDAAGLLEVADGPRRQGPTEVRSVGRLGRVGRFRARGFGEGLCSVAARKQGERAHEAETVKRSIHRLDSGAARNGPRWSSKADCVCIKRARARTSAAGSGSDGSTDSTTSK